MSDVTAPPASLRRWTEECMGTVFSFAVPEPERPAGTEDAVARAVEWLHWVDRTFSTYRADSAVRQLSAGARTLAECPPEVAEVLAACADVAAASGGYFSASAAGGLDPSGLVKGWAIERASDLLRDAGVRDHAVGGGGDIQFSGEPAPGRAWHAGVVHPLRRGELLAVVAARDLAVATSGTAERGAHVLNPLTGRPAGELVSVTLVGARLGLVDAYATAALAMGRLARDWLEELAGVEALAVAADGTTWQTAGFADHLKEQAS